MQTDKKIAISEIFHSLQGEGKNTGKPSIFIRFAGCNLSCTWCDSKYTWHKDFLEYEHMDFESICKTVNDLSKEHNTCQHIIFTGGEPLMFQAIIEKIMKFFAGFTFEVETNGSFATELSFDQINVSYKLKNAQTRDYDLKIPPQNNVNYKFVVDTQDEIKEVQNIASKYHIPNQQIYLMPQGTDTETLMQKTQWLSELCKKHNMNLSTRLHVLLWGDKKGV